MFRLSNETLLKEFPNFPELNGEYNHEAFPESETFHDGSVFNDMKLYWRSPIEKKTILVDSLEQLSDLTIKDI